MAVYPKKKFYMATWKFYERNTARRGLREKFNEVHEKDSARKVLRERFKARRFREKKQQR